MEVWDQSDSNDIIIYNFNIGYVTYLAEVEISTKKLLSLKNYERYVNELPDEEYLPGELEYNTAYSYLKKKNIIE